MISLPQLVHQMVAHLPQHFAAWITSFHLVWYLASPCVANEQALGNSKQIVILYTHRTLTPINADWDRGIRSALSLEFDEPLDIEIEYLNLVRHKDPDYLRGWIELLKSKYAPNPPDLVLPVFSPAVEFTLKYREVIFPNVPMVFCSASPRLAELAHKEPKVTGVSFRLDIAGTVETVRRLNPTNNRLIVVTGCSEQELAFKRSAQEAIRAMETGMEIDFIEGLPRNQLFERVAAADRNTSILMCTYEEDVESNHYSTVEIVEQISAKSPVPVYGLYDTLLGHGILGGDLASAESQGRLAGGLAARVLRGERPEDIPVIGFDVPHSMFDARQLSRWKISAANLPPGSEVLFGEATLWEQFGKYLVLGFSAFLIQSLIIFALLVNRSRRVTAEREARNLAGKILTAQEDERRYLAREMHDDLTQRLAASAIEAGVLEQRFHEHPETRAALSSLKDSLISVCDDVHRLSRQIHPAILDDFGLEDALRAELDRFGERNGIKAKFVCGGLPLGLSKEVGLCIYRIVQEAIWNVAKHAQTDRLTVDINADSEFVHLEICDFGLGFDPNNGSANKGLGLASMNERARLVRGTFTLVSSPGCGAKINVKVPLPEPSP